MSDAVEVNFDGIVGPTHNYAGLSPGNLASQAHANQPSNPKQAALQGLAKMKRLADLGFPQAVLPPHDRPSLEMLRRIGLGDDLHRAGREAPDLLAACSSASAMWAANAATVSPSADTTDGRLHVTPARLSAMFHRSFEHRTTGKILRAIFADESLFTHHLALPASPRFGDEGAANHLRLTPAHGEPGLEIFVYGSGSTRFVARQSRQAGEAIARLHGLRPDNVRHIRQNPAAIDAGAFHNDVVAVANLDTLLYHASAFAQPEAIDDIRSWFRARGGQFHAIAASEAEIPLADAVSSYLFNSQLCGPPGDMTLIAPLEAQSCGSTARWLAQLLENPGPIRRVEFVDVRQSMHNGGGPACLRLRIVLTPEQLRRMNPGVLLTPALHQSLTDWVKKHYRDELSPPDLADPQLLVESRTALDELTRMLSLGSIYEFQSDGSR